MKFNQRTTTVVQGRFTGTCCCLATFYHCSNSSDSDSEAEIDPDLFGAHPFSHRNRTDAPSEQALSNTARRQPQRQSQDALLTIAWASRQCMLAQLSTSRTLRLCHRGVQFRSPFCIQLSRHIPVGLVQLTGRPLGV